MSTQNAPRYRPDPKRALTGFQSHSNLTFDLGCGMQMREHGQSRRFVVASVPMAAVIALLAIPPKAPRRGPPAITPGVTIAPETVPAVADRPDGPMSAHEIEPAPPGLDGRFFANGPRLGR